METLTPVITPAPVEQQSLAEYRASREAPAVAAAAEPNADEPIVVAGEPVVAALGDDDVTTDPAPAGETPAAADERKKRGGFQRKIEKLERENAELKAAKLAGAPAAAEPAAVPVVAKAPEYAVPKPKLEDCASIEEFTEKVADWKLDQRDFNAAEKGKADRRSAADAAVAAENAALNARWAEGKAKVAADFDSVLAKVADVELSALHQRAFLESEFGPQIAYAVAQDRPLLERIAAMTPLGAAREIGKLETAYFPDPNKEIPEVSKAPAPIRPLAAGVGAPAANRLDPAKLSLGDYRKARESGRLK